MIIQTVRSSEFGRAYVSLHIVLFCLLLSSRTLVGPSLAPLPHTPSSSSPSLLLMPFASTPYSLRLLQRSSSDHWAQICAIVVSLLVAVNFPMPKLSPLSSSSSASSETEFCFLWELPHSSSVRKLPLLSLSICFVQLRRRGLSPSPRFVLFSRELFSVLQLLLL